MLAVYKKEIKMFFYTMEAYVAISVFFTINSLILWYIPSEFNIFYNNEATLLPFFLIAPWVLLLLIPAITMKMISSEFTHRTNLILLTKPIKVWQIIIAKFLASFTIGLASILPSLIFVYSIYRISNPKGNIDQGELIGSYLGIIMITGLYSAIGLFCSSLSKNSMINFITTIMIILLMYLGFEILGQKYHFSLLKYLSIQDHYKSIKRGIIDSKDIIYFTSMIICFLYFSIIATKNKKA